MPTNVKIVPTMASAIKASMKVLLGRPTQNQLRSRADTTEKMAK